MILLRANQELRQTFEKLIQTMKVPVKWSGIFAVVDDYMILLGEVRSLFFHFESKKVVTNLIDILVREDEIWEIMGNTRVRNVINMILYAFGKWGTITGLKVEKNYAQLNRLFIGIMREVGVEAEYTQNHFYFYKGGMRITYEDVIQAALEEAEEEPEAAGPEAEEGGLWHKIVWKSARAQFVHVETTLNERRKKRLGNNFYMIGYLCPKCGQKLHMVVYPMEHEFRIETEEGGVLLARACACDSCNCFYTPRPERLLAEGDIYILPFEEDRKAYEDYLELLGRQGARISNSNYNEYIDKKETARKQEEKSLEELSDMVEELSEEELDLMEAKLDEAFYPDTSTGKYEKKVRAQKKKRKRERQLRENREKKEATDAKALSDRENPGGSDISPNRGIPIDSDIFSDRTGTNAFSDREGPAGTNAFPDRESQAGTNVRSNRESPLGTDGFSGRESLTDANVRSNGEGPTDTDDAELLNRENPESMASGKKQEILRKYEAKLNVMDRFSDRQLNELKKQLETDKELLPEEKAAFLKRVSSQQHHARIQELERKAEHCADKTYAAMKRVAEEIRNEGLPMEDVRPILEKLEDSMNRQAKREVRQIMEHMPPDMDRAQYRSFVEKLHTYEGIDLSEYEPGLKAGIEKAERSEIAGIVKHARKNTREDLIKLSEKLSQGGFLPEFVTPYLDKINNMIRQMDEAAIDEIVKDAQQMSFAEGKEAYDRIAEGEFLPELKVDALKMLEKRLSKIKSDESDLLVQKLKSECEEAGIRENSRHHFYPARKVLMGQADVRETEVIDCALASYASGRGLFEYPILVVDTSRGKSGKEGMILTPDHLYYSTFLTSYGIDISSIDQVTAQTGLFNRGIYVHQKNGTKTKVPYAVETKELSDFAQILEDFIHYLQEKPDSRSLTYLAKEKHDTICCFRCGTVYRGGMVCPKCGFKNNG